MNQTKLVELLEDVLGTKGKKQSKGEYVFSCPVCHHYKPKLIIKLDPSYKTFGSFHCWVCSETDGTKGRSLYSFLKMFNATDSQFDRLKDITGDVRYVPKEKTTERKIELRLPEEYIPLWKDWDTIPKRHSISYLKNCGIDENMIMKYQIGYAKDGDFRNRIILPSFDVDGKVNYFTARAFFKENKYKYRNPDSDKGWTKNIVGYEWLINWELPIVLVEGVFDAIAVRRNAIPLFGKSLPDKVLEGIVSNRPPAVYMCLDRDAIRDAIKMMDKIIFLGIPIWLTELGDKDPNDLGFEKVTQAIKESVEVKPTNFMKLKIEHGIS